jgi:hypothetical protein
MTRTKKTENYDQPNRLMKKTIELVKKAGLDDVFFKTRIPLGWLQKFANGTFKNPSVNRVVFIYETLTNTKIL